MNQCLIYINGYNLKQKLLFLSKSICHLLFQSCFDVLKKRFTKNIHSPFLDVSYDRPSCPDILSWLKQKNWHKKITFSIFLRRADLGSLNVYSTITTIILHNFSLWWLEIKRTSIISRKRWSSWNYYWLYTTSSWNRSSWIKCHQIPILLLFSSFVGCLDLSEE